MSNNFQNQKRKIWNATPLSTKQKKNAISKYKVSLNLIKEHAVI